MATLCAGHPSAATKYLPMLWGFCCRTSGALTHRPPLLRNTIVTIGNLRLDQTLAIFQAEIAPRQPTSHN